MLFRSILRKERERRNLTQDELAQQLGYSRSKISMYEAGRREPRLDDIDAISDFFNIDVDYLLGRSSVRKKYLYDEFGNEYVPSDQEKTSYYLDPDSERLAIELHNNPRLRVLLDASKKTTPEELEALIKIVEGMTEE